jgi:hypothetical protein
MSKFWVSFTRIYITVSGYGLNDRADEVRFPAEARDFFSSLGSGVHPASCTMGTGGPFPGDKARRGAWRWPLTPTLPLPCTNSYCICVWNLNALKLGNLGPHIASNSEVGRIKHRRWPGVDVLGVEYKVMSENIVRFQVLTAASMKFRIVFWDVLQCKIIVDRKLFYTAVHPRRQLWTSNNVVRTFNLRIVSVCPR